MGNIKYSQGFIPLVFLLYGGIILLVGLAGFLGFKEYQLKQKTLGIKTTVPTILPSTPELTQTPKPTPITQKTTTTGIPSRTGAIITYHEWCTQKDISVYQNELITKKSSDGKNYSMTQKDWGCYEKYLANKNNGLTNTNTNSYIPTTYYSCTLCYHYSSGDQCTTYSTLVETKAQCDAEQVKINSYGNAYVIPTPIPTSTISTEQEQAAIEALAGAIQACWDSVDATYNQSVHNCNVQFGGSSSASQACIDIASQTRQRDRNACEGR